MMNNIFKVMLFVICLNVASAITAMAIVDNSGNTLLTPSDMGNVPAYNANMTTSFSSVMGDVINPSASAETSTNFVFRLLDLISLGFIKRALQAMYTLLFGFTSFLDAVFGNMMTTGLHNLLFPTYWTPGLINGFLAVGWTLGAFWLWTNKTVAD